MVRNRHLGNQNGVIPKWCEDQLFDFVLVSGYSLPQVSHAEGSVEGLGAAIMSAEDSTLVREKADSSAIAILFRAIIVEKFRSTFILPNLDVAVIGGRCHDTAVP